MEKHEKHQKHQDNGEKREKAHNYDSRKSFANTPKGSIVSHNTFQ